MARPTVLTDKKASYNGLDAVGPCMDLSVHVPNGFLNGGFQLTSNLKINSSISHGSKYILFTYWSRGLFLWMVQRKSRFRKLKRDSTTQEFGSGTFTFLPRAYWPKTSSR